MNRYKLDKEDIRILSKGKHYIDVVIEELLERGVRPANIEIELIHYIKKALMEE